MKLLKQISIHILILVILVVPILTHAGENVPSPSSNSNIKITNPFNCGTTSDDNCTLMDLIRAVLENIVMPIAAVAVVMYIIYAGFTYVTAQGNPAKVAAAHQRLLWSLIGGGILLGAAGISKVVQNTITGLLH